MLTRKIRNVGSVLVTTSGFLALAAAPLAMTGCEDDNAVEEAVEDTEDTVDDAVDDAGDAIDDAADEVEDAVDG